MYVLTFCVHVLVFLCSFAEVIYVCIRCWMPCSSLEVLELYHLEIDSSVIKITGIFTFFILSAQTMKFKPHMQICVCYSGIALGICTCD